MKDKNFGTKTASLLVLLVTVVLISGCVQSIAEIKDDAHVGNTVTVSGTVATAIKIGSLSGYTINDKNGDSIAVSSERLPAVGDTITVTGVVMKDTVFGFYIKAS